MNRTGLVAFLLSTSMAWSYVPLDPAHPNIHRSDYANVQFLVNQAVAPGLNNANGSAWITSDSDPLGAIAGALSTWSGIATSALQFAPAGTTAAVNTPTDRQNVIVFSDTPANRSLLGSTVLALTTCMYMASDGAITDSDIVFNPAYTFSTSMAYNTVDLQAVLTHELGHALGAGHTTVLGASMFQATSYNDNHQATLSPDDIAFAASRYPAQGGNGNGILIGKATLSNGSPIRGGAVTVLDPSSGITIGSLTSLTDGSFEFQAPPGNYLIYVEPLGGYVVPANLNIPSSTVVDTNFQSTFLGGNDNPSMVNLTAGASLSVNIQADGPPPMFQTPYLATDSAGSSGDMVLFERGPVSISSGQAADILISGPGIDPLTEQDLQILGAGISIRAGTLRKDTISLNWQPVYRVTVDIAPAAISTLGTLVLSKGSNLATFTGVFAVGQAPAASIQP
jgi:hypothetical protein